VRVGRRRRGDASDREVEIGPPGLNGERLSHRRGRTAEEGRRHLAGEHDGRGLVEHRCGIAALELIAEHLEER
jgi:hypothetical protein